MSAHRTKVRVRENPEYFTPGKGLNSADQQVAFPGDEIEVFTRDVRHLVGRGLVEIIDPEWTGGVPPARTRVRVLNNPEYFGPGKSLNSADQQPAFPGDEIEVWTRDVHYLVTRRIVEVIDGPPVLPFVPTATPPAPRRRGARG